MGADFRNRWFFVGGAEPAGARAALVARLREAMNHAGFREVATEGDGDRSLVVGPAGRWVFIGDSAGSTEWADDERFDALTRAASALGTVVDVHMSDDASVHISLYRLGRRVDRFGNADFPFFAFRSEAEAAPFRGRPELWADLLLAPDTVGALRAAWVQGWGAVEVLAETGRLFGWDPDLLWVGYTYDSDGVPTKYDEFLADTGVQVGAFDEYHFRRPE